MPQTASGRATPAQASSVFQQGYRRFVAGADVQKQRTDAHAHEYAEVAFKGTQRAICCPAGGELHQPDGTLIPVAPWDWVVELPDGTMGSLSAEQVADAMEFVDGPDAQREAFEETVKSVENARKQRVRRNPPVKVEHRAETRPHPDGGEAADREFDERAKANLKADYERQVREAREQLQRVVDVAKQRKLVSDDEATEWLSTGFAPDGVQVTFQQALGSWEVTRVPQQDEKSDPGDTTAKAEGAGKRA